MVPEAGIEPAYPKMADFKSAVFTNSTTRAKKLISIYIYIYFLLCFLLASRVGIEPTIKD